MLRRRVRVAHVCFFWAWKFADFAQYSGFSGPFCSQAHVDYIKHPESYHGCLALDDSLREARWYFVWEEGTGDKAHPAIFHVRVLSPWWFYLAIGRLSYIFVFLQPRPSSLHICNHFRHLVLVWRLVFSHFTLTMYTGSPLKSLVIKYYALALMSFCGLIIASALGTDLGWPYILRIMPLFDSFSYSSLVSVV